MTRARPATSDHSVKEEGMRDGIGRRSVVAASAFWILAVSPASLGAQVGTGVIEGRITEAVSGRPLDNAQVSIAGTNLGGATNETGTYRITGVPVVLNTSFNEDEPIVCTPRDAIECFLRTRMDVLYLGNYVVRRN